MFKNRLVSAIAIAPLAAASLLPATLLAQSDAQRHEAGKRMLAEPAVQISGPTSFEQQAFDVLHYDALVDLTAAPLKVMSGVCEIRLRWVLDPATSPFYFHLRDLTIDSIYYNGVLTTATASGDPSSPIYHYALTPPSSAKVGDSATVRIVYGGEMSDELGSGFWGGVSSTGGTLFAMGVGFLNNYVSTTQHWLPCYDHPSDKATFRGRFRVKSGKTVASNGLVTITPESDTTVIYDWRHNIACATYLLTFAVDDYVALDFPGETPPMVVYSRPADSASTRVTFKLLPAMVRGFEERFGTYPFEKVGYCNTPIGAMEHQTMVSFPTSLSRSRDTVNSTGAHELAHQWFGDLVSPLDFRHAWLNESFATFCESVWAEVLGGYAGYLKSIESEANAYLNSVATREGIIPLYDFPRTPPSSNYPSTIYQKGAVVVGMLRFELGDSIFYAGIHDFLTTYAYGVATTEQLRSKLEAHAGRSLQAFFDQWIYGKGWPMVSIASTRQSLGNGLNRVRLTLTQTQPDAQPTFTNLPIEFGFRAENGAYTYRMVRMNSRSEVVELDSIPDYTTYTVNRGPSVRVLMKSVNIPASVEANGNQDSGAVTFIVRPNPISKMSHFTVEAHGTTECGGIQYELFDSSGRRLLLGRTDSCEFPIPTSGFGSGVYVLRFKHHELFHDVPVMITR